MKSVELSVDDLNKIVGYLGKRPYEEVFLLLDILKVAAEKAMKAAQDEKRLTSGVHEEQRASDNESV